MISYKRDVLERQSLSEVKMGRGSPICERVRKKIVEYFKNNVTQHQIAKALQISSSTVHNIIKRFRETGEISVRKGQGWRPLLDARGLRGLRRHCITHRHDSVIDITKWAQEYFQKPLSINTIHRAICRCQLKLYHAKRKPYVNMVQKRRRVLWAKAHLKWTVSKWKSGSDEFFCNKKNYNLTLLLEITDAVSSGLRGGRPSSVLSAFSSKASISDGMGVYKCIRYGQLACFGRQCWKVYKGFRAKYAPLQTTCISAGQCKTTYCSYYNSMAS